MIFYDPADVNGLIIVDTTSDDHVVVNSSLIREEGTPESALAFAARLRQQHGPMVEELVFAIEEAAQRAMLRREKRKETRPS